MNVPPSKNQLGGAAYFKIDSTTNRLAGEISLSACREWPQGFMLRWRVLYILGDSPHKGGPILQSMWYQRSRWNYPQTNQKHQNFCATQGRSIRSSLQHEEIRCDSVTASFATSKWRAIPVNSPLFCLIHRWLTGCLCPISHLYSKNNTSYILFNVFSRISSIHGDNLSYTLEHKCWQTYIFLSLLSVAFSSSSNGRTLQDHFLQQNNRIP